MQLLEYILAPLTMHEFMRDYWDREAVFIPSQNSNKFKHFFSWKKLNYLVNSNEFDQSLINCIVNEQANNKSKFIKLCQQGESFRLNSVHQRLPELAELIRGLRQDISSASNIHINVYCSFPGKKGFVSHYDLHETFVLQIEGKKEWNVFQDSAIKYPVKSPAIFLPPVEKQPYLNCTLNPGDTLYIPRGHLHYAVAVDEPSLHLTVGVRCSTGIDFLEWLANELCKREEWRKSLPVPTATPEHTLKEYMEYLSEKLKMYIAEKNVEAEYLEYFESIEQSFLEISLPSWV